MVEKEGLRGRSWGPREAKVCALQTRLLLSAAPSWHDGGRIGLKQVGEPEAALGQVVELWKREEGPVARNWALLTAGPSGLVLSSGSP